MLFEESRGCRQIASLERRDLIEPGFEFSDCGQPELELVTRPREVEHLSRTEAGDHHVEVDQHAGTGGIGAGDQATDVAFGGDPWKAGAGRTLEVERVTAESELLISIGLDRQGRPQEVVGKQRQRRCGSR